MKKNTLLAMLLALVLILCGCSGEKEEAYRMIQVLEVSGTVSVERASMGTFDAYEGMRLESGDKISVGEDSWLKIKMDEDKYALIEPASVLRLEASGSSADSKTVLHLEAGAISNRLENELSAGSSYEVNTPNSTMAVRGTVFRVEVVWNEDGVSVSDISVYDGKVASRLVYPDGAVDGEGRAVLILGGTEAQIWGNKILSKYVTTETEIALEELKLKTLRFLEEAVDAGMELNIPEETLKELIAVLEQEPESGEESGKPAEETTAPTEETTEPTEETTVPATAPTTPRPTTPPATQAPASDDSDDSDDSEDSENSEDAEDAEDAEDSSTEEEESEATTQATEPPSYTVKFLYGDSVFATQTVVSGKTATKPTLLPAASGDWDATALSTPITENTEIQWVG